jgi:peptidoglycan/LPS O-acetylase OafA/YrhL
LIASNTVKGAFGGTLHPLAAAFLFVGLLPFGRYFISNVWIKLSILSFPVYLTHYFLLTFLWGKLPQINLLISGMIFLVCAFLVGFIYNFVFEKLFNLLSAVKVKPT